MQHSNVFCGNTGLDVFYCRIRVLFKNVRECILLGKFFDVKSVLGFGKFSVRLAEGEFFVKKFKESKKLPPRKTLRVKKSLSFF